jgi:hypothetical protein
MGRRPWISFVACALVLAAGLVSGRSLASDCDGWYCDDPVVDCVKQQQYMTDLCCKDLDGNNISHCITADRYEYLCDSYVSYGPGENFRNPEDVCE